MKTNGLQKRIDTGLLILRLGVGFLMLLHGIKKLKNFEGTITSMSGKMEAAGLPGFLSYGFILGEFLAPLMLIIGFRTKIGALIVAGTMGIAILVSHASEIFDLQKTGGLAIELPLIFLLASLALVFTGGGRFALSSRNILD